MKIDLTQQRIYDFDGNPIGETTMATLVANALVNDTQGDAIKLYELAQRIYRGETELDTSDYDLIKQKVEGNQTLTVMAKGQILLKLREAREAAKK